MTNAGESKLLTDREMAQAEARLMQRQRGVKRRSKLLTDQEAYDFEVKAKQKNFARDVLRSWNQT